MAAQQTMFEDQVAAEEPRWTPRLPSLEDARTQTTATVSHQEILARPIFSRSRAPFVPPAPPAPKPAPPAVAFTDPGFVLGGVMVNGAIKRLTYSRRPTKVVLGSARATILSVGGFNRSLPMRQSCKKRHTSSRCCSTRKDEAMDHSSRVLAQRITTNYVFGTKRLYNCQQTTCDCPDN
jgi:hypothetical protein